MGIDRLETEMAYCDGPKDVERPDSTLVIFDKMLYASYRRLFRPGLHPMRWYVVCVSCNRCTLWHLNKFCIKSNSVGRIKNIDLIAVNDVLIAPNY